MEATTSRSLKSMTKFCSYKVGGASITPYYSIEESNMPGHKDPEKRKEYNRLYVQKNRKRYAENMRRHRKTIKGKEASRAEYHRRRYGLNRQRFLMQRRLRQYGLSQEAYDAKLQNQKGLCAVCGKSMKVPHIDHNHSTGLNRDLLCKWCNTGLGMFFENIDSLRRAIEYLQRHSGQ